MNGRLIPEGLLSLEPLHRNLFENLTTVQFDHRVLAILSLLATTLVWLRSPILPLPARTRTIFHSLMGAAVLQVALGISTLLLVVPLSLAAAHQAGALLLFTVALWVLHELQAG